MSISPSYIESLWVHFSTVGLGSFPRTRSKTILLIDAADPIDCRKLLACLSRILIKEQRSRTDYRMGGHRLGCFQIAFETRVLHKLNLSHIRKPFSPDGFPDE